LLPGAPNVSRAHIAQSAWGKAPVCDTGDGACRSSPVRSTPSGIQAPVRCGLAASRRHVTVVEHARRAWCDNTSVNGVKIHVEYVCGPSTVRVYDQRPADRAGSGRPGRTRAPRGSPDGRPESLRNASRATPGAPSPTRAVIPGRNAHPTGRVPRSFLAAPTFVFSESGGAAAGCCS
jgi:hypothetical protein